MATAVLYKPTVLWGKVDVLAVLPVGGNGRQVDGDDLVMVRTQLARWKAGHSEKV